MQQRRLRLGDILDDYCPRERRITNHAIVAMIEDEVKQTRCTTCDADHEYKQARIPPQRRKKEGPDGDAADATFRLRPTDDEPPETDAGVPDSTETLGAAPSQPADAEDEPTDDARAEDDGPVHRRLIRATLPRDGQPSERKEPEFTIRQPGMRAPGGHRRGHRHERPMQGAQGGSPSRFHGSGQGPRHPGGGSGHQGQGPSGNRQGPHPGGPRGNRQGPPGGGRGGRKRGR